MNDEDNQQPELQLEEVATEPTPQPTPEPTGFTQDQVNAIVAKEVAKAKRQVKKAQPKQQEPTTEAEPVPDPRIDAVMARLDQMAESMASDKSASDFKTQTAGLTLDATTAKLMKLAHASEPELFAQMVKDERAKDAPPAPKGPGVSGLPAPGAPPAADRLGNPVTWSKDTIAQLKADGTFLQKVKAYRGSMPGSGGGLFPAKNPGKGRA